MLSQPLSLAGKLLRWALQDKEDNNYEMKWFVSIRHPAKSTLLALLHNPNFIQLISSVQKGHFNDLSCQQEMPHRVHHSLHPKKCSIDMSCLSPRPNKQHAPQFLSSDPKPQPSHNAEKAVTHSLSLCVLFGPATLTNQPTLPSIPHLEGQSRSM